MVRKLPLLFLLFSLIGSSSVWAQPYFRASPRCEDGSLAVTTAVSAVFAGSGNLQVVAGVAAKKIKIYQYVLFSNTTAINIKFTEGTGANCVTGPTDLTGVLYRYSAANQTFDSTPLFPPLITNTAADALCLNASAAATITGSLITCQE